MSMGGCYIAILENELEKEISNQSLEKNIDNYERCTLEQAWDAFRILFGDEIYGEDFQLSLGEQAFIHNLENVKLISEQLNSISEIQFKSMLSETSFKDEDFYWNNIWTKEPEDMLNFFNSMKEFFNKSAQTNKIVLFYIA